MVGQTIQLSRRRVALEHLAAAGGVLVTGVEHDSPAEHGGLRQGDIIIGLAGEVVSGIDDLQRVLTENGIGKPVDAVVLREGQRVTVGLVPDQAR